MTVERKLAEHEVKINQLEKQFDDLHSDIKPLERLGVLMEQQMKQTSEITNTLQKINDNLSSLNHDVSYLKENVNDIDSRVGGLEKEKLARLQKKIDRRVQLRDKIFTGVAVAILSAALLLYFGLN